MALQPHPILNRRLEHCASYYLLGSEKIIHKILRLQESKRSTLVGRLLYKRYPKNMKIKQIDQRYHTHVLGLAAVAAAFTIVSAGAPYLLAQDYTAPVSDTILTAPMPVDQQPVNTQPPSSGLIPSQPPIQ